MEADVSSRRISSLFKILLLEDETWQGTCRLPCCCLCSGYCRDPFRYSLLPTRKISQGPRIYASVSDRSDYCTVATCSQGDLQVFLMYSVSMRIGQHRGRASMKRMWFASTSDCDVLRSNSSRQVESPYALNQVWEAARGIEMAFRWMRLTVSTLQQGNAQTGLRSLRSQS